MTHKCVTKICGRKERHFFCEFNTKQVSEALRNNVPLFSCGGQSNGGSCSHV